MAEQIVLWHDSIEDALGTAVKALGGPKVVAKMLWPTLADNKPETAYTRLMHALNPEKAEKLSPDEVIMIGLRAREISCNAVQEYLAGKWLCEFKPLAAEEAKKRARKAERKALLARIAQIDEEDE
jgi:hypothetical protein